MSGPARWSVYNLGAQALAWCSRVTVAERLLDCEEDLRSALLELRDVRASATNWQAVCANLTIDVQKWRLRAEDAETVASFLDENLQAESAACAELEARVGALIVERDESRNAHAEQTALNALLISTQLQRDELDAQLCAECAPT